ncbi:tyrosine-type recombinase/integrase [Amycolatopsis sp. NPDC023774]|uniref:tyrosine-type recombinase/integrase n=1 Tax=Amycolatopsis sp. NPDC023774 TaxID=3155015 RepID=UPI0033EEBDF5
MSSSTIRAHAAAVRAIADTIHPHAARHLYAIAAEARGIPIRQISRDLGHASLATTEAYLEQGRHLADSAAPTLADLITARRRRRRAARSNLRVSEQRDRARCARGALPVKQRPAAPVFRRTNSGMRRGWSRAESVCRRATHACRVAARVPSHTHHRT